MNVENEIIENMSQIKAADAADLFLSPYISQSLLFLATREEGPAMWIVNRSDVFDQTLELFKEHPHPPIAQRAQEKIKARKNPSELLPPPLEITKLDLAQIPTFEVEEILGHPRVSFDAIFQLSHSSNEEHRASSALSLSRRFLEYPPNSLERANDLAPLEKRFSDLLLHDPSAFVRSYCSRIPFLKKDVLQAALRREENPVVQARLLQHPQLDKKDFLFFAEASCKKPQDELVDCVISLDARVAPDLRKTLLERRGHEIPYLAELFHLYQIHIN
jgi:hypothetical protein